MTKNLAGASPVDQPVRPCAWWVPAFDEPLVSRGETKPMLWPEAQPLYDRAALDAAVAAERERLAELMERQHTWISNVAASRLIRDAGRSKE